MGDPGASLSSVLMVLAELPMAERLLVGLCGLFLVLGPALLLGQLQLAGAVRSLGAHSAVALPDTVGSPGPVYVNATHGDDRNPGSVLLPPLYCPRRLI